MWVKFQRCSYTSVSSGLCFIVPFFYIVMVKKVYFGIMANEHDVAEDCTTDVCSELHWCVVHFDEVGCQK